MAESRTAPPGTIVQQVKEPFDAPAELLNPPSPGPPPTRAILDRAVIPVEMDAQGMPIGEPPGPAGMDVPTPPPPAP